MGARMTWVSGAWASTAWAPDAWPGGFDTDIPVAIASTLLAALTVTGQPNLSVTTQATTPATLSASASVSQSSQVSAEVVTLFACTPVVSQSACLQADSASSISILGSLVTGWPVVSAIGSGLSASGQPNLGLQVRPTVVGVKQLVGTINQDLQTTSSTSCSLSLANGLGVSTAFASTLPGSASFTGPVYLGWPVVATTSSASIVVGQPGLSVSPKAQMSPALSASMEWKLDQGMAGQSTGQGVLSLNPTVSRGFAGTLSGLQGFASQVGVAYAAAGSTDSASSFTGVLGTVGQVAGANFGTFNAYGLLNQDLQVRGSVAHLLSAYWSNLPTTLPTEMVVIGDKDWSVVSDGGIVYKPPTRLLSAVSLQSTNYALASRPKLTFTPDARTWMFDPTNSDYTFEGLSHESYGTEGPGRGQDSELRLQPRGRNF